MENNKENQVITPKITAKTDLQLAEEAFEQHKRSLNVKDFSKRSCNACYGRGIEGTVTVTFYGNNKLKSDRVCSCALRRLGKYKEKWIKEFLDKKPSELLDNSDKPVQNQEVSNNGL